MLIHIFKSVLYKLVQFSEIISEMPTLHTQHEQQKSSFLHNIVVAKECRIIIVDTGAFGYFMSLVLGEFCQLNVFVINVLMQKTSTAKRKRLNLERSSSKSWTQANRYVYVNTLKLTVISVSSS